MKSSFASFPMLAIPVLLYNLMAIGTWLVPGLLGTAAQATTAAMITIPMPAPGATLPLSFGHLVLLAGLVALFLELISSTSSSDQALLGDALTLVLFVIAFVEFLLLPPFATGTFFLLVIMVLMDTVAGFVVSTVSARKDIALGG